MNKLKIALFLFLLSVLVSAYAQNADSVPKQRFELSFGQSLLFVSKSKEADIHREAEVVLPTSTVLFFAEFRIQKIVRMPVFLNIATETRQFLVNGQLINEKVSPTFGTGLVFKAFEAKIDSTSKIELEGGPLAGFIFDTTDNIRAVPLVAGRFRIIRNNNFVMYLGLSYSFGLDIIGLLYGTGTVF